MGLMTNLKNTKSDFYSAEYSILLMKKDKYPVALSNLEWYSFKDMVMLKKLLFEQLIMIEISGLWHFKTGTFFVVTLMSSPTFRPK